MPEAGESETNRGMVPTEDGAELTPSPGVEPEPDFMGRRDFPSRAGRPRLADLTSKVAVAPQVRDHWLEPGVRRFNAVDMDFRRISWRSPN